MQFVEMYSYGAGGTVTKKRLQVNERLYLYSGRVDRGVGKCGGGSLRITPEGAMTSVTYPSTQAGAGEIYFL